MNENEYLTEETLSGVEQNELAMSDGNEADSNVMGTVTVSELLSQTLGKEFTDDETALKAVKDTFSYVGEYGKLKPLVEKLGGVEAVIKKMEEEQVVTTTEPVKQDSTQVDELTRTVKEMAFYNDHPELKPYKDVISAMGSDPNEVVQSEVFKKVYEPLKSRDESNTEKSVLHSNSRLAEVTSDYAKDFQKAQADGTPEAWTAFAMKHKGIPSPKE